MIVIAIIAILAALAIPNLLSSRLASNEAAAISYLKTWGPTQELYLKRFDVYADDHMQMVTAGLVALPNNGYDYHMDNASNPYSWWGGADPTLPGSSGNRYFFVDFSGVIRFASTGPANQASSPLGQ